MRMPITKAQVMVPWLGQKVVLMRDLEWTIYIYPRLSVGTLDALRAGADGDAPFAEVVFDNDASQDVVQVPLDDLLPLEFAPSDLPEVEIQKTPAYRLELLQARLRQKVTSDE